MQPTGFIDVAASQLAQRHDTHSGLVADKNDFPRQRGQAVEQGFAFGNEAFGVVEHQQIGQPQSQAIDQQATLGAGGFAQDAGKFGALR